MSLEEIKKQAEIIAQENAKENPNIKDVYWFPDENEIHIVEVEQGTTAALSGVVEPFYFDPSPKDGLTAASGIAIIRPDEYGALQLPEGWADWSHATKIWSED